MRDAFFKMISKLCARHPWKVIALALVLTIVSSFYAAFTIKLNANLDDLVSEDLDYHKRYLDFLEEFGDEEYLYVVVDATDDMTKAKQFVVSVAEKLKELDGLKQVIWKIDNPALEKNFLLYMSEQELNSLKGMLGSGPFGVRNVARWNSFAPLISALADRVARPVSTKDEQELSKGFTFIDGLFEDMEASLQGVDKYESRLQSLFFGGEDTFDTDGYYRNGDLLFIMIMPDKDFSTMEVIERPLKEIRMVISDVKEKFPGIDAGLTGRPVLAADEIATSDKDMKRATTIAIILVGLAFVLFFRSLSRPGLAMLSLVMGIAWTFGFVALFYGTLNILSIVFTLILIGASVEYAIHFVARYQEELAESGEIGISITKSLATAGRANLTSAFTTAAAFLTIIFTDFEALSQLGIIAASGIVLCLISMSIVLPAMIMVRDRMRAPMDLKNVKSFTLSFISPLYKRPWVLGLFSIVLTVALVPFISQVSFDNNLLNLQAAGLESVEYENLIIEKSSETTWFARSIADSIGDSHEKAKQFASLSSVRKVDDVERILPENQAAKIKIVRRIAPSFKNLRFSKPSEKIDSSSLESSLLKLKISVDRLLEQAFSSGRIDAVDELGKFSSRIEKLLEALSKADDVQISRLGHLQQAFFEDIHKNMQILASGMRPGRIGLADLPSDLVSRFVSMKGRYALFIYPEDNIWDPDALEKFITDIKGIDPNVLGTPIEVYESGKLMRNTFKRSAVFAFIVICILVLIDFRSIKSALLAITPLTIGMLWLFGFMGLFKIPFNMANFFAIPILIGIGVDFGVHMVHRLRSEQSLSAMTTSTTRGVVLTAITNAVGFGAMVLAAHRGIASLGQIMAIGATACLLAALVALPPLAKKLNWGRKIQS